MFRGFSMGNYGSYASRDLEDYRAHYPNNKDDIRQNKNLLFFRNEYPMQPEGALIETVIDKWKGNYRFLESSHSFIQWLFPIQEKGMNWESQVLQKHEIASMRADPNVLERVVKVFRIMLDFYGMELVDEKKAIFRRLDDYKPQYRNLNSSSHNYLRITRMLKNLGEMGFEHLKLGWLEFFFQEICINRLLPNCETSFFNYWSGTIYDDAQREAFIKSCQRRAEEAKEARKKRQREIETGSAAVATATSTASETPNQSHPQSQSQSQQRQSLSQPGHDDSLEESGSQYSFDTTEETDEASDVKNLAEQGNNGKDTQPKNEEAKALPEDEAKPEL